MKFCLLINKQDLRLIFRVLSINLRLNRLARQTCSESRPLVWSFWSIGRFPSWTSCSRRRFLWRCAARTRCCRRCRDTRPELTWSIGLESPCSSGRWRKCAARSSIKKKKKKIHNSLFVLFDRLSKKLQLLICRRIISRPFRSALGWLYVWLCLQPFPLTLNY